MIRVNKPEKLLIWVLALAIKSVIKLDGSCIIRSIKGARYTHWPRLWYTLYTTPQLVTIRPYWGVASQFSTLPQFQR